MPPKPKGRPRRAQASARALSGIDLHQIDPRMILLRIAADPSAPAGPRVAACKALLAERAGTTPNGEPDPVADLALRLMRGAQ